MNKQNRIFQIIVVYMFFMVFFLCVCVIPVYANTEDTAIPMSIDEVVHGSFNSLDSDDYSYYVYYTFTTPDTWCKFTFHGKFTTYDSGSYSVYKKTASGDTESIASKKENQSAIIEPNTKCYVIIRGLVYSYSFSMDVEPTDPPEQKVEVIDGSSPELALPIKVEEENSGVFGEEIPKKPGFDMLFFTFTPNEEGRYHFYCELSFKEHVPDDVTALMNIRNSDDIKNLAFTNIHNNGNLITDDNRTYMLYTNGYLNADTKYSLTLSVSQAAEYRLYVSSKKIDNTSEEKELLKGETAEKKSTSEKTIDHEIMEDSIDKEDTVSDSFPVGIVIILIIVLIILVLIIKLYLKVSKKVAPKTSNSAPIHDINSATIKNTMMENKRITVAEYIKTLKGYKCEFCGELVSCADKFCSHCGKTAVIKARLRKCPKCYRELPPDCDFCPTCGKAIDEVELKTNCPKCGADLFFGKAYCSKCGINAYDNGKEV